VRTTAPRAAQAEKVQVFRVTERRTPERPCLNCGDPTPGNYCRNCGQRKVEVHISTVRMLMEALDDQFSINSALPRTLGALLFRPGHLTREYMGGRIARYIPPFRLYLVTSVVFFLALSLLPELRNPDLDIGPATTVNVGPTGVRKEQAARPTPPAPRIVRVGHQGQADPRGLPMPPVPPPPPRLHWLDGVKLGSGNATLDSIGNERIAHFARMEPREALRQIVSDYLGHVPQTMFVLLPLFAGLLKVLYLFRRRFYVEHFVFALHVHAFAFVTYLAMIVVRWPPAVALLFAWLVVYLYLALKKVYGQGWLTTLAKYAVMGTVYFCVASLAAVLTLVATVLLA
jgi:hypothetical protein